MLNHSFHHDESLIEEIAARFGLRRHNAEALEALVSTLDGEYDPAIPQVLNMATGSGKTYLMAAFVEYLRVMGVRNVMIITPSLVVQTKTVQNFTFGASKYIEGADKPAAVVTPADYSEWTHTDHDQDFFGGADQLQLFVFNIQQLIAPADLDGGTGTDKAANAPRRARKFMETHGSLYDYLADSEDLVVIADEHHLYGASAKAFRQSIRDLHPAAVVGLTASADKSDHVIFSYPLYRAIQEGHVKQPVIAYRKKIDESISEEQQLRDALILLAGKQHAFDTYTAANPDTSAVNAVLFVICQDVDDATETARLLRTAEYFGVHEQVLQVDNKHNDATTMGLLDKLDTPGSPVRAVVSVNKLREGWDVKNIAVMVARRAMASDVLTQQTMGRGLRLPFGKLTGAATIDQLDIISHKSFSRLAKSEEVLKAFGLETATDKPEEAPVPVPLAGDEDATPTPPSPVDPNSGTDATGEAAVVPPAEPASGTNQWNAGGVTIREFDDVDDLVDEETPVEIKIQDKFAGTTFLFPSTAMVRETRPFVLRDINLRDIEAAAGRITDAGAVMEREEIVFRKLRQGMKLTAQATEQADVGGISVTEEQVTNGLLRALFSMKVIERTEQNLKQAKKAVIPTLLRAAPITVWTDVAAESAMVVLKDLVSTCAKVHSASLRPETVVTAKELPVSDSYLLDVGENVGERVDDGRSFAKRKHYGPWDKGLFGAASFDSYTGEYKLAELLNKSSEIVWWKRLYLADEAQIAWQVGRHYHPDFVALDRDDVFWILEGKDAGGRSDSNVQAKARAAEELITRLVSEDHFEDQRWGYLVAYEDSIAKAQSWAQLRESSDSVKVPPL